MALVFSTSSWSATTFLTLGFLVASSSSAQQHLSRDEGNAWDNLFSHSKWRPVPTVVRRPADVQNPHEFREPNLHSRHLNERMQKLQGIAKAMRVMNAMRWQQDQVQRRQQQRRHLPSGPSSRHHNNNNEPSQPAPTSSTRRTTRVWRQQLPPRQIVDLRLFHDAMTPPQRDHVIWFILNVSHDNWRFRRVAQSYLRRLLDPAGSGRWLLSYERQLALTLLRDLNSMDHHHVRDSKGHHSPRRAGMNSTGYNHQHHRQMVGSWLEQYLWVLVSMLSNGGVQLGGARQVNNNVSIGSVSVNTGYQDFCKNEPEISHPAPAVAAAREVTVPFSSVSSPSSTATTQLSEATTLGPAAGTTEGQPEATTNVETTPTTAGIEEEVVSLFDDVLPDESQTENQPETTTDDQSEATTNNEQTMPTTAGTEEETVSSLNEVPDESQTSTQMTTDGPTEADSTSTPIGKSVDGMGDETDARHGLTLDIDPASPGAPDEQFSESSTSTPATEVIPTTTFSSYVTTTVTDESQTPAQEENADNQEQLDNDEVQEELSDRTDLSHQGPSTTEDTATSISVGNEQLIQEDEKLEEDGELGQEPGSTTQGIITAAVDATNAVNGEEIGPSTIYSRGHQGPTTTTQGTTSISDSPTQHHDENQLQEDELQKEVDNSEKHQEPITSTRQDTTVSLNEATVQPEQSMPPTQGSVAVSTENEQAAQESTVASIGASNDQNHSDNDVQQDQQTTTTLTPTTTTPVPETTSSPQPKSKPAAEPNQQQQRPSGKRGKRKGRKPRRRRQHQRAKKTPTDDGTKVTFEPITKPSVLRRDMLSIPTAFDGNEA